VVDGPAQGGGVGVAAAADFVLASERSSFALPEVLFGLIPAMVLPVLLERIRPQLARRWALTAESQGPSEALAAGLVDRVVPSAELERAERRVVRELSRARPAAVRALSAYSARALELPLVEALAAGGELTLAASLEPAVGRALRSFREYGMVDWDEEEQA
jgi:enoyl-CoA hydratase/carnithine racemase